MAGKYKISIRKIIQVFFTLAVSVCCLIAMISASNIENNKTLSDVQVHIISGKKYHFVEEQQILKEAITNRNIDVKTTPVCRLDIKSMERVIELDPWVADAKLYVDNNRVLHMVVTQRIPVARLFQQDGTSCYMDNTLSIMPLTPNFNFYASVVTNVPVLTNDSVSWMAKKQIAHMLRFVQTDTFWNAQVSHLAIDSGFTFELYPVLGDQVIVFGDTSRTREKFSNLYAFYKKILNRIGWDRYDTFDLRFRGQVIASPSLPYKGPVDKANATMNWLTAFVDTEVRKDSITAMAENRGGPADASEHKEDAKKPEPAKDKPAAAADRKTDDKKAEPAKGKPAVSEHKAVDKKHEDGRKHDEGKKPERPTDKQVKDKQPKAVIKLSDLGNEKKR